MGALKHKLLCRGRIKSNSIKAYSVSNTHTHTSGRHSLGIKKDMRGEEFRSSRGEAAQTESPSHLFEVIATRRHLSALSHPVMFVLHFECDFRPDTEGHRAASGPGDMTERNNNESTVVIWRECQGCKWSQMAFRTKKKTLSHCRGLGLGVRVGLGLGSMICVSNNARLQHTHTEVRTAVEIQIARGPSIELSTVRTHTTFSLHSSPAASWASLYMLTF